MGWDFNLEVRIFEQTSLGNFGDVRLTTPALLRAASNGIPQLESGSLLMYPGWSLLVPAGTDIRGVNSGNVTAGVPSYFGDLCFVPDYTNKLYRIRWVDDAQTGTDNEYRIGILEPVFKVINGVLTWYGYVGEELIYPPL